LHIEWLTKAELDLEPLDDLLRRLQRQQSVERVAGIRWIRLKATIETPNRIKTVCSRRSRIKRAMASTRGKRYANTSEALLLPASHSPGRAVYSM
jgi:hypothetical protein